MDTTNKFMVGVVDDRVLILNPPRTPLTKAAALNLAAWLVALADDSPDNAEFDELLKAVQNT